MSDTNEFSAAVSEKLEFAQSLLGRTIVKLFEQVVKAKRSFTTHVYKEILNCSEVCVGREALHAYRDCVLLVSNDGETFTRQIKLAGRYRFVKLQHTELAGKKQHVKCSPGAIPMSFELLLFDFRCALEAEIT